MMRCAGNLAHCSRFLSMVGPVVLGGAIQAFAQPVAVAPYRLSSFPGVPPGGITNPDDLAISVGGSKLWVGYQNNASTTGQGGNSNLVEYDIATGNVRKNIAIAGHLDGLKINPATNDIWATENEDGNPTLS